MWPFNCYDCKLLQLKVEHLEMLYQLTLDELNRTQAEQEKLWNIYIQQLEHAASLSIKSEDTKS